MPPTFEELGVPPVVRDALTRMRYETPTPVQAAAIPRLLGGADILLEAETGSGKTAAFGVPAVVAGSAGRGLRVIILVPTRELARQVAEEVREIGTGSPFRAVAITGGVQGEAEERALGGDVRCIIATPGRLLALIEERKVRVDNVKLLILDEADRMLDMGFKPDVERVLEACAARTQTALVSATLPPDVVELARAHMRQVNELRVGRAGAPASLRHHRVNVFPGEKEQALVALLKKWQPERAIVFVATRKRATEFTKLVKKAGFAADALQGEMTHDQRRHVFDLFSRGISRILVATDIAGRGLDVPEMQLVVNVDLPEEAGAYSHRSGRAARMGREGDVINFVRPEEKVLRERLERESGGAWTPYRLEHSPADLPPGWGEKGAPKKRSREAPRAKEPKGPARTPKAAARGATEDLPSSRRERKRQE